MTREREDVFEDFAREFIRNHHAARSIWRVDRVLIPTDFSLCSLAALEYAQDLAQSVQAELIVMHVEGLPLTPADVVELTLGAGEREVSRVVEQLRAEHVRARGVVRAGAPVEEILEVADHEKVSLIVAGTHGRTGFKHFLMGSVAEGLVRAAKCPVLTVRSPDRG